MREDLEDYLSELRARHYSESRLLHVNGAVTRLALYLGEAHAIQEWGEVNVAHLQAFTVFAATRHRTPKGRLLAVNSLRQWLSCVRVFFAWMKRRGRLPFNPAAGMRLPRTVPSLPRVPSVKAMVRLIQMPDTGTAVGLRDRALMETLYATGVRHAEAYRLNLYDVDLDSDLLAIRRGKGNRDRFVPLTKVASYWLEHYLDISRPQLAGKRGEGGRQDHQGHALWLSNKGGRLSYQMIGERILRYAARAKVKATVHSFRHACATHLLRRGAGTRYIQRLLGHQSVTLP